MPCEGTNHIASPINESCKEVDVALTIFEEALVRSRRETKALVA